MTILTFTDEYIHNYASKVSEHHLNATQVESLLLVCIPLIEQVCDENKDRLEIAASVLEEMHLIYKDSLQNTPQRIKFDNYLSALENDGVMATSDDLLTLFRIYAGFTKDMEFLKPMSSKGFEVPQYLQMRKIISDHLEIAIHALRKKIQQQSPHTSVSLDTAIHTDAAPQHHYNLRKRQYRNNEIAIPDHADHQATTTKSHIPPANKTSRRKKQQIG